MTSSLETVMDNVPGNPRLSPDISDTLWMKLIIMSVVPW